FGLDPQTHRMVVAQSFSGGRLWGTLVISQKRDLGRARFRFLVPTQRPVPVAPNATADSWDGLVHAYGIPAARHALGRRPLWLGRAGRDDERTPEPRGTAASDRGGLALPLDGEERARARPWAPRAPAGHPEPPHAAPAVALSVWRRASRRRRRRRLRAAGRAGTRRTFPGARDPSPPSPRPRGLRAAARRAPEGPAEPNGLRRAGARGSRPSPS